jgi:hypothetical protein
MFFDKLAKPLRHEIRGCDEAGMNYWRITAVLKDGRVYSNVFITGSFQLGFPKLSPFKAHDIIAFECTPRRGSSGAPVREADVDLRANQSCCHALPRIVHTALSDVPDLEQRCDEVTVPPMTEGRLYRCRSCGQLWKEQESGAPFGGTDLVKVWSVPTI